MIAIKSLKKQLQELTQEEFKELIDKIYQITAFITEDYPGHYVWYYQKHIPRTIGTNIADVLYAEELETNRIVGVSCVKKDEEEKKICTLFVEPDVRGQKLGTRMLETSFQWLGTNAPLLTIADYKLPMFAKFIEKYGWTLDETVRGLYNDNYAELCFNGTLTKVQEIPKKHTYTKKA